MASRRTGDKPLSEAMVAYITDANMSQSVSMNWDEVKDVAISF